MSSSAPSASAPLRSDAHTPASAASQTTTRPLPSAWRRQASAASARGPSVSSSTSTGASTAIIGSCLAVAGRHVQRELAAHPRDRVVHVLAQHDAAAVHLHFQHAALGQPQRVAYGLGQGDLAAFGYG